MGVFHSFFCTLMVHLFLLLIQLHSVIRLTLIFYVGVDESAGRKRRCANSDEWRFQSPNRPNVDPRIEKLLTSSRHFDRRALGKK